ncbi:MAG: hypothetical protein QNL65_04695 [Opitutales bacterium]|jgi:hypothetical protein|tara:strand:+ start:244 stop:768 length:525 start_codon:yes stop_codon:yes gene_type:complete
MKSRLRSRWYRASEKPLESSTQSQKSKEPFGEISSASEKLVDDLSNAKPPTRREGGNQENRRGRTEYKGSSENRNDRSRSHKPRNPNRDSKRYGDNRENKDSGKPNSENSPKKDTPKKSESNSVNKKPKRRRSNQNRSDNEYTGRGNGAEQKKAENKSPKKTGLSGFISKLFGG